MMVRFHVWLILEIQTFSCFCFSVGKEERRGGKIGYTWYILGCPFDLRTHSKGTAQGSFRNKFRGSESHYTHFVFFLVKITHTSFTSSVHKQFGASKALTNTTEFSFKNPNHFLFAYYPLASCIFPSSSLFKTIMASLTVSNCVALRTANFAATGNRKIGQIRQWSPILTNLRPLSGLHCGSNTSFRSTGVRAQVATLAEAGATATPKVEAPVVVVTGASRGIGRAIALTLGKAGCKVSRLKPLDKGN